MQTKLFKQVLSAVLSIAGLGGAITATQSVAQGYPDKPIRIIVPYGTGGGTDILTRNIADRLAKKLGQSIIVENRPGADGVIGTAVVATSKPDGYTYLMAVDSHIMNPLLYKTLPYDTFKDMTGVTLIARSPYIFVTKADQPGNNIKEFVEGTRKEPNKRSLANSEKFSLLLNQALASNEKLDVIHVPYKGSGPMMIDVAAGTVTMSPTSILAAIPYLQSGRMKALGVTGNERSPAVPNVPTLKEQGFDRYDFYVNYGLYAPAGTPRNILETMQKAVKEVVETPEMKAILIDKGAVPVANSIDEFNALQKANFENLKKLAEQFNMKPE